MYIFEFVHPAKSQVEQDFQGPDKNLGHPPDNSIISWYPWDTHYHSSKDCGTIPQNILSVTNFLHLELYFINCYIVCTFYIRSKFVSNFSETNTMSLSALPHRVFTGFTVKFLHEEHLRDPPKFSLKGGLNYKDTGCII